MCYNSIMKIKDPGLEYYYRAALTADNGKLYSLYTNIEVQLNVWLKARTIRLCAGVGPYPHRSHAYTRYFRGFGVFINHRAAWNYGRHHCSERELVVLRVEAKQNPREAKISEINDYGSCLIFNLIKTVEVMS